MVLKLALFLHIISAIFWIGGMLFLVLVVAPYLKTISDPKAKSQIYQVVGKQYRFWGWVAIITLLVTGPLILTGLYGLPLSALSDPGFHASGFGKAVAYKLSLVAIIVISSFLHDFWIGPRARSSPRYSSMPLGIIAVSPRGRARVVKGRDVGQVSAKGSRTRRPGRVMKPWSWVQISPAPASTAVSAI